MHEDEINPDHDLDPYEEFRHLKHLLHELVLDVKLLAEHHGDMAESLRVIAKLAHKQHERL